MPPTQGLTSLPVQVAFQTVLAALLGVSVWLIQDTRSELKSLSDRLQTINLSLAAIQSNRFTSKDGMVMYKLYSALNNKVETLPPQLWRDMIRKNEKRIGLLEANVGMNR